MNETLALARYGWTRVSVAVIYLVAAIAFGLLIAGIAWQAGLPSYVSKSALGLCYLALIFCCIIPVGMFSFSFRANLLDPISCYDPWLMRLPIQSWKLALIPVGLVTAWLSTVWIVFAVLVRLFDGHVLPLSQALGMSASAVFCFSLSWKPQRSGWHRVALLVVSTPLLYILAFGILFVMESNPRWLPQASIASVFIYAISVAFAVYSVKQARVSTFQQSQFSTTAIPDASNDVATQPELGSAIDALQWHDRARTRSSKFWTWAMMVPILALMILALPATAATAIVGYFIIALITMTLIGSRVEPTVHGFQSSLPSYLLAIPIRSRSMAWARLRGYAIEYCRLSLCTSLLLLLSFAWPENRETAWRWWTSVASGSSAATPMRILMAFWLPLIAVAVGFSLRVLCIQLYGRSVVVLWLTGLLILTLAIPTALAIAWFIHQTSWENVESQVAGWRNWLFWIYVAGVVIKLCLDATFFWQATRHLVSVAEAFRIVASWVALVIASTLAWWMIWPATQVPNWEVPFTTVLVSAVLVIPLSVCFAGPLAVEANRHRHV